MNKFDEKCFVEKLETNYFQTSNYLFDLEFEVKAVKRIINKNAKGKGKHTYNNVTEIRNLNNNEKLVFVYICRCANNGKTAFPSYNTIADKCCISKDTARKCIEVLYNNSFILKKNRGHMPNNEGQVKKNFSNVYKINNDLTKLKYKVKVEKIV